MINVLIIEDDLVISNTVNEFLSIQEGISIVGCYTSMEDFIANIQATDISVQVVILDISLPGISGIDGIKFIKELWPAVGIIMFSVMDDGFSIFQSLCEGAVGYLTKDFTMEGLKNAVIDVYEGRGSMSPSIARKVAEYFHPKKKLDETLTSRELDIVNGIIDGLSYKLLARKLDLSIDTVRKHIKNIYKKLQINSKSQLVTKYFNSK